MAEGWSPVRLALFGVGQVGTMIGLAARSRGFAQEILVADPDPGAVAASRARGLQPDGVLDPSTSEVDADVVVLAAPVSRIVELIGRLGPGLRPEQLLIDTGSAKAVVADAMAALPDGVHAIGGHPMAGTEVPGAAGARPEALADAPFVLTPVRDDPEALARGRILAEALGSRPVVVSPADHDRIVARTSHLPHLMAFALHAATHRAADPASVADVAGTGFRGAARLAASDPEMVAAFLSANRDEVKAAVRDFLSSLAELEGALDEGPTALASMLRQAADNQAGRVDP